MKKTIYFVLLLLVCLYEYRSFSVYAKEAATVSDEDYGSLAYTYIQEICEGYPERVFSENRSLACGDYLIEKLGSFGYDVSVCEFTISASAVSGRNIICQKKGNSPKQIILCAHYDCADTMGCDDNGSGISVLLEVAARMARMQTPDCTLTFIFFDGEEEGYVGSKAYVSALDPSEINNILYVINIDSVAGGDYCYIHGGTEAGTQAEFRNMALVASTYLRLDMTTHPGTKDIPAGSRMWGSDHHYFAMEGIPYIYLEASVYSDSSADGNPVHYQTQNALIPNGQIMHTAYDDFHILETVFPGRMQDHFRRYTILMLDLAMNINADGQYSGKFYLPGTATDPAVQPYLAELHPFITGIEALATEETRYAGELLDSKDFQVFALYSDGSKKAVNGWAVFPMEVPLTEDHVTVYYQGFSQKVKMLAQDASLVSTEDQVETGPVPSESQSMITEEHGDMTSDHIAETEAEQTMSASIIEEETESKREAVLESESTIDPDQQNRKERFLSKVFLVILILVFVFIISTLGTMLFIKNKNVH